MGILAFVIGAIAFLFMLSLIIGACWLMLSIPILVKFIYGVTIVFAIVIIPSMFYFECKDLGEKIIEWFKNRR